MMKTKKKGRCKNKMKTDMYDYDSDDRAPTTKETSLGANIQKYKNKCNKKGTEGTVEDQDAGITGVAIVFFHLGSTNLAYTNE